MLASIGPEVGSKIGFSLSREAETFPKQEEWYSCRNTNWGETPVTRSAFSAPPSWKGEGPPPPTPPPRRKSALRRVAARKLSRDCGAVPAVAMWRGEPAAVAAVAAALRSRCGLGPEMVWARSRRMEEELESWDI